MLNAVLLVSIDCLCLLYVGACSVAGGNLVDCSAAVTAQNGDSALINNIADDCTTGSQPSKTGKFKVCVNFTTAWPGEGTCNLQDHC